MAEDATVLKGGPGIRRAPHISGSKQKTWGGRNEG